jgi:hypothetical protein
VCKLALVALLAALMPCASAQRPISPPHFASSQHSAHARPFPYPLVFFADSFDYEAQSRPLVSSQPPIVVTQAPVMRAPQEMPEPLPPPAQPLLIELQGGHYIRVNGEEPAAAEMLDQESSPALKHGGSSTPAIPSQTLAPAVLVFRDGHREEVGAYTIADGVLYAQGNYYTDGSWNRKIDLSSLNLPATIEASRSRGVHFLLPTAPNEVVTRP